MPEKEAQMRTRVGVGRLDADRSTSDMGCARFIQTTSQPVDGLPDSQLHAHVSVFNTTWDHKEQRWKAGHFRKLKRDVP